MSIMASSIVGTLSRTMQKLVQESKISLIVRGIGCEVLKNLVMLGSGDLELIDLEAIEVSSLNRQQLLFQEESVDKGKSSVAKQSVLNFYKNVNVTAHLVGVTDQKYGNAFYNKLILNAFDNSRHVPIIESGYCGIWSG